jgi:light-regulated signal transduction histidine kinase (bacteriophytochrome)
MEDTPKKLAAEGLAFFGRMNAAISHDMRNVLAIINETANLLDELVELQQAGQIKPNPEKLQTLSRRIVQQVERGQNVIGNMNAFAHSIEVPVREVDLARAMSVMAVLSRHFATGRALELSLPDEGPRITTHPFFLNNLIHHTLNFAIAAAGPDKKIRIAVKAGDGGGEIVFSGLAITEKIFPSEIAGLLATTLGASLHVDTGVGAITITVPGRMPGEVELG